MISITFSPFLRYFHRILPTISYMLLKKCYEIIVIIKNFWYQWQLSCFIAYLACVIAPRTYDILAKWYQIFLMLSWHQLKLSSWNLKFQGEWFWIWCSELSHPICTSLAIMTYDQVGTSGYYLWKSSSSSRVGHLRQAALTARLCRSRLVWVSISDQQWDSC